MAEHTHDDEETIHLEDDAQYTPDEAFDEAVATVQYASVINPLFSVMAPQLWAIFKEYVHWLYSKPGTHRKVSELLAESGAHQQLHASDANATGEDMLMAEVIALPKKGPND